MAVTQSSAEAKIAMIRDEMPAVQQAAYLNTGTFGPLPKVTVAAMTELLQRELVEGRLNPGLWETRNEAKTRARAEAARVLGCLPDNIVLTRHTTDGMNIGIMGLNWRPGDELIISNLEHPGGQGPAYNVARRYGVGIRTAQLGDGAGDVVGKLERLINRRTRMLIISHLSWNTGTLLPLKEIIEMAHAHNVLVIADAAQSAGSVPVNVLELGVDVYATPGQKWLCGPEGTGATYISDEALEQLNLTVVGYTSAASWEHRGGYFTPKHTAERHEAGGMFAPALLGQATSLSWIRETVGFDWVYERIRHLGDYAWQQLSAIPGISILTPRDQKAGLISFCVDGMEPPVIVERLAQQGVVIRHIGDPVCARVSTGFYNNEEDIDRLAGALDEIRRSK